MVIFFISSPQVNRYHKGEHHYHHNSLCPLQTPMYSKYGAVLERIFMIENEFVRLSAVFKFALNFFPQTGHQSFTQHEYYCIMK